MTWSQRRQSLRENFTLMTAFPRLSTPGVQLILVCPRDRSRVAGPNRSGNAGRQSRRPRGPASEVEACGPQQIQTVVVPTLDQEVGVKKASVHDMRAGRQAPLHQGGVDVGRRCAIGGRAGWFRRG